MTAHIKALEEARAAIADIEQQIEQHKARSQQAKQELQRLTDKEQQAESAYKTALQRFANGDITEQALDDTERELASLRAELEKRRPRLAATVQAGETVPVRLVQDAMAAETKARNAVVKYWNEKQPEIEQQARAALPYLKLWSELYHVDLTAEINRAELPPCEMPRDRGAVHCRLILSSDRDRAKRNN
jgi:chromosome segregation ATPase